MTDKATKRPAPLPFPSRLPNSAGPGLPYSTWDSLLFSSTIGELKVSRCASNAIAVQGAAPGPIFFVNGTAELLKLELFISMRLVEISEEEANDEALRRILQQKQAAQQAEQAERDAVADTVADAIRKNFKLGSALTIQINPLAETIDVSVSEVVP